MTDSINTSNGRPWWKPVAFDWSRLELFVMRLSFAALAFWNVKWETRKFLDQPSPNGLAHFFDLTWLGKNPPGMMTQGFVIAFLFLYVVGLAPAVGLLPWAFYATLIGTLGNSQGAINHSWQMVTMMGLAQMFVYAWPRRGAGVFLWIRPDHERHRQAAWAALIVIAASYVVCGLVKVVNSDGMWLVRAPWLAVQLYKTHYSHFYDTLEMPPQWLQQITETLVQYPNLARLLFGGGLFIELVAFAILINRRWALIGGVAIIALHMSISKIMNLNFEAHMLAALIYLVNVPGIHKAFRRS
ncbi:MAG: hypothetical protein JNJ83_00660 [Verrucomicrobiaceae bacterium]|nr:hypothetical protein [Verrucomicrobiaceae bacterium]